MTPRITHREMEVAELISFGLTEKEMANYLDISIFTLQAHKRNLFNKTGCRNIADVTRWYIQQVSGIRLEPREAFKKIVSVFMLILIVLAEFSDDEFIRTRTRVRTRTAASAMRSRARGRMKETLYLQAV